MESPILRLLLVVVIVDSGNLISADTKDATPHNLLLNEVETMINAIKLIQEPAVFNLYTRENAFGEEQLLLNNTEILYASHFNESRPTKLIIHGFSDTGKEAWIRGLVDAYLKYQDVNVIVLGWGVLAADPYPTAANNTKRVGEYLGTFLEFLCRESNLDLKDVHMCGHSLGSHVAGFAGSYLDGRVGRITGLDPASPLFETGAGIVDPDYRLDPSDAQFVDVIHTSGTMFGFLAPIGHVDFYPNSGKFPQPGCNFVPTNTYCSHTRAYQLMTESIGSTSGFKSRSCDSWEKYKGGYCDSNPIVLMGEYASTSLRGNYFLTTNNAPPFAID
ncbi:hypothetical protein QAD02_004011 [Eretmocerus hayati]|uniref:Uncharacterized protein n=1 Tax=Eretmocerus hayati TaxID=131215 RepID=A0ACC2NPC4_9HYME|nr:hypothetical protein QAD02_004011 [Eretmocerus hayati]